MADAKMKVSQMGNVLITDDYDIMNVVTYNSQSQTYTSGKANVKVLKDYMIGNNDISALGDGSVTGAILNVKSASETADSNIAETMAQNGAHNLWNIAGWAERLGQSYTKNGTTYTFNYVSAFYGSPYVFSDTDIDVVVSGTVGSATNIKARVGLYNAAGQRVARSEFDTNFTISGSGCKIIIEYNTNGQWSITDGMIRLASDHNTDYTPYVPTNRDCMSYAANAKLGAHNLLRFPTLSELKALNTAGTWSNNVYTFGNATFTVNESAETVTVNCDGTGSAGLYFSLFNRLSKRYYLPNGTYKVNGLDNGEDSASYFAIEVSATTKNSTSQAWYIRGINTDGALFTYDDTQIDGLGVTISIMGNHTANNVVVKPMIRLASDTDTSHALYAMTNMELTKKVDELYGSTNKKISYIRGYYPYGSTISNILTLIQSFLTEISITNDIGVIDVVIAGNTPWSVRGYCLSTKDFAALTAMRYDGSCKLFYRMSSTDTIKDFTTT